MKKLIFILIIFTTVASAQVNNPLNSEFQNRNLCFTKMDSTQIQEDIDSTRSTEEQDSAQTVGEEDSANNTNESKSSGEDEENDWTYSGYLSLMNTSVQKGFVIGNDKPLMGLGSSLSYSDFSINIGATKQAAANIWADYSFGLDYSHAFSDWFSMSAGYSYFKYLNDPTNPNSENSNSIYLVPSFSYSDFSFSIGYEMMMGNIPVSYLSATLNYNKNIDKFTIDITADVTSSNYTKSGKAKLNSLKKISNVKSFIYTGILYLTYDLPKGFYVGLSGTVTEDYKGNIDPIVEANVGYSIGF